MVFKPVDTTASQVSHTTLSYDGQENEPVASTEDRSAVTQRAGKIAQKRHPRLLVMVLLSTSRAEASGEERLAVFLLVVSSALPSPCSRLSVMVEM